MWERGPTSVNSARGGESLCFFGANMALFACRCLLGICFEFSLIYAYVTAVYERNPCYWIVGPREV